MNEYVLKEKETNEILSDKLQIDIINMEMIDNVCYNELNEKEKIIYQFCKMLTCETSEELVSWSEQLMSKEDSQDLLNQVEERSNDSEYIYMDSAYKDAEDYFESARISGFE